jgi:hypothetical protein
LTAAAASAAGDSFLGLRGTTALPDIVADAADAALSISRAFNSTIYATLTRLLLRAGFARSLFVGTVLSEKFQQKLMII